MILIYRPELDNPPMAKESVLGFSFIAAGGLTQYIDLEAGVNRDFPDNVWEKIKDYDVVKKLESLGAIRTQVDSDLVAEPEVKNPKADSIVSMNITDAMTMIENSFDITQLDKWDAKDQRIRIKQAIARRRTALQEGKG